VTSANDVDEAKRDGTGSQVTTALRHQQHAFALLEAAVEQTGGDELDKLAQKFIRRGMPPEAAKKAAKKALARKRVAEARAGVEGFGLVEVEESGHKIKCPKCGHVMSASLSKCPNCGHDMTEARKAKFAKLDEAAQRDLLLDEPEAADALAGWRLDEATLTAAKRKKLSKSDYAIPESESYPIHDESHARNALARVSQHGSPAEKKRVRAAVKRKYPHVVKEAAELVEVKSSAYPGLERKPGKQNWVDYAGGLPSYIERIAKHIHYEHGHPIGQAIAFAVGTVRRWCAGGSVTKGGASKSNVTAATKAKACAALAEWEAKKKKGSAAMHAREAATDSDFDLGALAVSLALSEVEALDIEVPELTQEQALQFLSEVELHEASYAHALHFDPRLHPRNRSGEFREILERLAKVGGGTEVTMPNGVAVRKRRGMSGFVVSRGGKKIATGNPAKIAQQALDATGIPEPGRERHMGVQSPRFAAAFEEGTGPKKGSADEVIRSVLSNRGDVVGKNVRAQRSGTSASIFSYDEPVAHVDHARREVMLNTHKYSPTTSGHRELVRKAAVEHGYGVRSIDRTEALSRAGMEARPFEKSASKRAMQPAARAASYRESERRNLERAAELHAQGNHEHAQDYEKAAATAARSAAEHEARASGDVKGDPGTGGKRPRPGDQTREQSDAMRREIRRLGVPSREEIQADGSRKLTWRIGTRTITKVIGRDGSTDSGPGT
jgi:rubrerythrin